VEGGAGSAATPTALTMVKRYIPTGGHGGKRSGSGLPSGYWADQGGRAAAAADKAARKTQAELKAIEKKAKTAAVWARAGVTIPREKKEEGAQGACGDV
jgi:hypothetical protein